MICPRCAKNTPDIHTCSPSDLVRKLEAEYEALRKWQEMAFEAHPNIDLDIEAISELRGE